MRVAYWVTMILGVFFLGILLSGYVAYQAWWHATHRKVVVEHTDYRKPTPPEVRLADDSLADKNPVFDPQLVDSRPLGDWEVNQSGAIIRLDCPMLKPDRDASLLQLHASYRAAAQHAKSSGLTLLPSANLVDGAGKQVDDGLFAAIELAVFQGQAGQLKGVVELVGELASEATSGDLDRPYLLAALELAGQPCATDDPDRAAVQAWLGRFEQAPMSSPAGFYTWSPELKQVWRTFRFLQFPLVDEYEPVARRLAERIETSSQRLEAYRGIFEFYEGLSNPSVSRSLVDLGGNASQPLNEIPAPSGQLRMSATFLPTSTSRETELFTILFPTGIPSGSNLMAELIRAIRSGEVDLKPQAGDGWYQQQVYALEALLLTDENQESDKLLLTAAYKRRLMEAFKAMMTKRRETHIRSLAPGDAASAAPLQAAGVTPRLRVEPAATFYLRTARAYGFVSNLLQAVLGPEALERLHGLTADGERPLSLAAELQQIRDRYYGFYLVTCEDIGMRPELDDQEGVDQEACYQLALEWLDGILEHVDLAQDTRVVVPIYIDRFKSESQLWATIGVRLAKLDAEYAVPPKVRPLERFRDEQNGATETSAAEEGNVATGTTADGLETQAPDGESSLEWQAVERYQLGDVTYVIAVDEFAEYRLKGVQVPTREAFRALCDRFTTKEEFMKATGGQ